MSLQAQLLVLAKEPLPGRAKTRLSPALLTGAVRLLVEGGSPVLGQAHDGGWWALGLPRPLPGAFDGVPMSTATTGRRQRARLAELGLPPRELPVLRDVDLLDDLLAVAPLTAPDSAVAGLVDRLGLAAA